MWRELDVYSKNRNYHHSLIDLPTLLELPQCFMCVRRCSVSVDDRISIIKCYYTSGSSARAALRKFKTERHLIKDPFTTQYIQQLVNKFEGTGSVLDKPKSGCSSLQDDRIA